MFDKLEKIEKKYNQIVEKLSDPEIIDNRDKYKKLSKEQKRLEEIVELAEEYREMDQLIEEEQEVIDEEDDEELLELAQQELEQHKRRKEELEDNLKQKLVPPDPYEGRSIIIEIRAGAGGDEASIFVGDLFDMYSRYADDNGWKLEVMDSNASAQGGFKEIITSVKGKKVYKDMKFESGIHRVQRVPKTESKGRIHTSAASVAVLPEPKKIDVNIEPNEIEVESFRSSGPGGQHVNVTDSAIRIIHHPTGVTVSCQDEKSQHKNRKKAMKILRARILDKKREEQRKKRKQKRNLQIGSGDRSQKIRTYNFPQNRVTDHRINYTTHNIQAIMDGDIGELIQALREEDIEKKLEKI